MSARGRSPAFPARAAVIALLALSAGCGSKRERIPTERLLVTKVPSAPAFSEPSADTGPDREVRWGEAYFPRGYLPDFAWNGMFEGRVEQRVGLVELSRGLTDAAVFAFGQDFLEADVPTTAWLCGKMALGSVSRAACDERLFRTVASENTLIGHVPCWQSDCPVAALRGGVVTSASLPALSDVRVASLGERPVVLAWSHWIRDRAWTGESLVVLLLDPPLARAGEVSLSETDARDPAKVVYWIGKLEVQPDGLRVSGRRSVREGASNVEVSGTNVDERWGLGSDGKLVKR